MYLPIKTGIVTREEFIADDADSGIFLAKGFVAARRNYDDKASKNVM